MENNAIGIFDSGVGGLTVVREVMRELPNEEIIYYGDTARVPYGTKSKETVTRYSMEIMDFLMTRNVKAVIIACGTVSSNSFDELRAKYDVPIIEMVSSGIAACLAATKTNIVGVIATEATIRSGKYELLLNKADETVKVYAKACPLFVPLAEEGWTDNSVAEMTARIYLSNLKEKRIDALIMACTHYPLLHSQIQKAAGCGVTLINPAVEAAKSVRLFLNGNGLARTAAAPPCHKFYISDNTEQFNRMSLKVLGKGYKAELVNL
jgi:glutamate racemase